MSALWPPGQSRRYAARTDEVAGMAGLEPASEGVKVPCLTTWLHPNTGGKKFVGRTCVRPMNFSYGVGEGIRTLGLQSHNLAR